MRFKTYRALTVFLFGIIVLTSSLCQGAFTVTWDHNEPRPDEYAVYARLNGAVYDYDSPIWEGPENEQTITNLLPPLPAIEAATGLTGSFDKANSEISLNWTQPPMLVNTETYYLVVRAQIGTRGESDFMDSADSEEVSIDQSNGNEATKWEVHYSMTSGGPYTKLDEVTSAGAITAPFTAVAAGTRAEVFFVVVTFGEEGTFSPDSAEHSIIVDRRVVPPPPQNVDVSATIPVQ